MIRAGVFVAIMFALALPRVDARPISYPGGWTVMQQNSGDHSSFHVHYSPTFKDSLGWYSEVNWAEDYKYSGFQYNRLVKRWNELGSQGNFYFKSSFGAASEFKKDAVELGGFIGLSADWETRRYFTSYEVRAADFGFTQGVHQFARIGIAPYIGDYGDVHTWLMLEAHHDPKSDTPLTLKPIVRLFYNVQLLEIGFEPSQEAVTLNWIVRF